MNQPPDNNKGPPPRRHSDQRRRHFKNNRQKNENRQTPARNGFDIEKIYEKYLNLLDQHLVARKKYHDFFYRADPGQKYKFEKNFYSTLKDLRDFEDRLAPDVKTLFEKRNNGYQHDRTYTTNHELKQEGDEVAKDLKPAEPHYLQSQIEANYSGDNEESVGTPEDYLQYKKL